MTVSRLGAKFACLRTFFMITAVFPHRLSHSPRSSLPRALPLGTHDLCALLEHHAASFGQRYFHPRCAIVKRVGAALETRRRRRQRLTA